MTSTTETETKVETAVPKEEIKDQPAGEATEKSPTSAPGSPTKTGTLKKEPAILVHKKDFEKDVVYLYQFARSPTTPSLSADCLKVENWLRINGIQYENVDHKMRYKSKKGNLPFVELNGKEIEDADIIIRELAGYFEKNLDDGLTNEQKMISHAFESMLNNHTGWIVRWWRYNHPQDFIEGAQLDIKRTLNSRFPNSILNFVFKMGFKKQLKDAVGYGSGRHSDEEMLENAKKDLQALNDCLGSNDYFFGKEAHLLDSTAFAHLVQFLSVPFNDIKEWLETETPNLIKFVDRVKARAWSDWDSILSSLEMNTHLPKKEPVEGEATEQATPAEGEDAATAAAEQAKKDAEAKKAEKKRLAEEKKKEREEKKKKEKEEKERIKKEKEEAAKAKKAAEAEAKAKAAEEAEKAKAEAAEKAKAEEAEKAEAAEKAKAEEATANGGDAPKPEVTAE